MPSPRRYLAAGVAAVATFGLGAAPAFSADAVQPGQVSASLTEVNLLNINDFHGYFSTAFACHLVTQENRLGADSTLFLSAGDNVGGSKFESAIQNDEPTIDFLNALGLDASAVGNHEFDQGFADLTGRIAPRSTYPNLGANVYKKGTTEPALPEYTVKTVNGVRVGVVGAVTSETRTKVSPDGITTIDFGDPVEAVNRVAKQLKDGDATNGEADIVVAEYHEGAELSKAELSAAKAGSQIFTKIVDQTSADVDVIFNGDKHAEYAYDAPIPGGTGTRPVIQAKQYGERLAAVELGYDPETKKVTQYSSAVLPTPSTVDPSCAGNAKFDAAKQIVDTATAKAGELGAQQIGTVTDDITTAVPLDASGNPQRSADGTWRRDDRGRESTLSNMIAQSYVDSLAAKKVANADIGVMNPGGVRAELYQDEDGITFREAANIMPFNNIVKTIDVTGATFKEILEQQWQPGSSRPFLALGLSERVTYTYDPYAPQGSHVTSIMLDGKPMDMGKTYTVASNNFLLAGGDGFSAFTKGTNLKDSGLVDQSLFVDWIKAHSPLSPDYTKHGVATVGQPTEATAGDDVTFIVSGLSLSSVDAPKVTEVTASIDGTDLGTFPVKDVYYATPAPTRNGEATVTVTLPKDLPTNPESVITLTSAPGGSKATFPIAITAAPQDTKAYLGLGNPAPRTVRAVVSVVDGDETRPNGTIELVQNERVVGTAEAVDGKAVFTLEDVEYGRQTYSARFVPADRAVNTAATARAKTVFVRYRTSTSASVPSVRAGKAPRATVTIGSQDRALKGSIRVRKGWTTLRTVAMWPSYEGRRSFNLPKLSRGTHTLTITYLGDARHHRSERKVTVTVR